MRSIFLTFCAILLTAGVAAWAVGVAALAVGYGSSVASNPKAPAAQLKATSDCACGPTCGCCFDLKRGAR